MTPAKWLNDQIAKLHAASSSADGTLTLCLCEADLEDMLEMFEGIRTGEHDGALREIRRTLTKNWKAALQKKLETESPPVQEPEIFDVQTDLLVCDKCKSRKCMVKAFWMGTPIKTIWWCLDCEARGAVQFTVHEASKLLAKVQLAHTSLPLLDDRKPPKVDLTQGKHRGGRNRRGPSSRPVEGITKGKA